MTSPTISPLRSKFTVQAMPFRTHVTVIFKPLHKANTKVRKTCMGFANQRCTPLRTHADTPRVLASQLSEENDEEASQSDPTPRKNLVTTERARIRRTIRIQTDARFPFYRRRGPKATEASSKKYRNAKMFYVAMRHKGLIYVRQPLSSLSSIGSYPELTRRQSGLRHLVGSNIGS